MYGMPIEEAEKSVKLYRTKLSSIPDYWGELNNAVRSGHNLIMNDPSLRGEDEARLRLPLPSGRVLDYGFIQAEKSERGTQYVAKVNRNGKTLPMKLWGGVLAENLSQALARDIFSYMMLEIDKKGIEIIFHVHDEVICECAEEDAEEVLATLIEIMSTPPQWIPDIPLGAEGEILTKYQK